MKLNNISKTLLLFFCVTLSLASLANAQSPEGAPVSKELTDKILSLDQASFDAFNKCDLKAMETFFAENIEFYHQQNGVEDSKKHLMEVMAKNLCGDPGNKVRRELIKDSVQIYPIANYGALMVGEHRFYGTQPGQKEKLNGIGKFIHLWQNKNGEWKMERVVSYGIRPAE